MGAYFSPASRLIDFSVPAGISSVLCRLTGKVFPVTGLYQIVWFAPCLTMEHLISRSAFSSSLYLNGLTFFLISL